MYRGFECIVCMYVDLFPRLEGYGCLVGFLEFR